MVKVLDDKQNALPDHVGWRLWQANRAWQEEFAAAMRGAGHGWFTEARASLLGNMPRHGIRQSELIEKMAISKQAVQQLLDGLQAEQVVERMPDPDDKRGNLLRYTVKGIAALKHGDRIKGEIEAAYRERLGERRFDALMEALRLLTDDSAT